MARHVQHSDVDKTFDASTKPINQAYIHTGFGASWTVPDSGIGIPDSGIGMA